MEVVFQYLIVGEMEFLWWNRLMILALLACFIHAEATSRSPWVYWNQMLPKVHPSPSAPSKGTNSVSESSSTGTKGDRHFPSWQG